MIEISARMAIAAPASRAFSAFVEPEQIGQFWFSTASQKWTAGATVTLSYAEFGASLDIQILSIRENRQIKLTWGQPSEARAATLDFLPQSEESCIVQVTEVGFNDYEALFENPNLAELRTYEYEDILKNLMNGQASWTFVLTCLKAYLESGITTLRTGLL